MVQQKVSMAIQKARGWEGGSGNKRLHWRSSLQPIELVNDHQAILKHYKDGDYMITSTRSSWITV